MNKNKKRILLINSHLGVGGIQSSLVNMANELCELYDVDLMIYFPEGPMKERLDTRIDIIEPSFALRAMGMSVKQAFKSKNLFIVLFKLLGSVWAKFFDNRLPIYFAIKFQKKMTGYDMAIAYRQEGSKSTLESGFVRLLYSKVEAPIKLAWIHCDATEYEKIQFFNRRYYHKVDKVIGVSKSVANAFVKMNPQLSSKTDYCYNFVDYSNLYKKSEEKQSIQYPEEKFICFSASRLGAEKGIVRGIKALAPIFEEHTDVFWYIAGDGPDRKAVEDAINDANLADRIILLGNQSNPYPYMKNADLYLSLSFHEAAPMVYMEAHALGVPVFTTRTSSSDEMLDDGVNAFICENSEEGIRKAFADLMANRERVIKAKERLKGYQMNNDASINKIRELIELG